MPDYKTSTFTLIVIAFVSSVITLSSLINFIGDMTKNSTIINQSTINKDNFNSKELDAIKDHIHNILEQHQGIEDSQKIEISIRESSLKQQEVNGYLNSQFIADVDQAKVSYRVNTIRDPKKKFSMQIACAGPKDSKYPNTFCVSDNGFNTIDAALGDDLPYRKTKENGKLYYKLNHLNNDKKLIADAIILCGDETAQEDVLNDAKDWVASHGVDRELIPIEINQDSCYTEHELHVHD